MHKFVAAIVLLLFLSFSASGFSEFTQALPEKQVDLFPLLVVPSSCQEFSSAFELELPEAASGAGEGYLLAQQSKQLLLEAAGVASAQKYYWLAGLTAHVFYAIYSYQCHSLALEALQKAVESSKKTAAALDSELSLLEFEQGASGARAPVLSKALAERRLAAAGSGGGEIAAKLEAAYRQSSYSWDHALSGDTRIVRAAAELYSLSEALVKMHEEARAAREALEASLLKTGSEWRVEKALAENSLGFIDEEQLEQVADEWFAFLPAATRVISQSTPSFRETIRKARLNFEESAALAAEAGKTAEARKPGWANDALEDYSQAVEKAILSSHYSAQAEERSLELEGFLSKAVAGELAGLVEKTRLASAENPVGASLAYAVAYRTASAYEELAGMPRGVKIREYTALLRKLREAQKSVEQAPSFAQALEQVELQLEESLALSEAAAKDGIETGFQQNKLKQARAALDGLKLSTQEDYQATANLLELALEVQQQVLGELQKKFGGLSGGIARLRRLKQFLSEEERVQLELYASAIDLRENTGALKQAAEWVDKKLAELESRAEKIVSQHLAEESETLVEYALAELDKPANAELVWSSRHEIPLDSKLPVEIEISPLAGAIEQQVVEKSARVKEIANSSAVLDSSRAGETHFVRVNFRKTVAKTLARRSFTVSATPRKLVRKTIVDFEAGSAGARVLVSEKIPGGSRAQVESAARFESQVVAGPDGRRAIAVVTPHSGLNQLNFTIEVGDPVSVSKSFSNDGMKLVFALELRNNLDERIEGMAVEFVETVGCITGDVVLRATNARKVENKRNGGLVAAGFSGIDFDPRETQYAWVEVQCNNITEYAAQKLQELSASPLAPLAAAGELTQASRAVQDKDYAKAIGLLSNADAKISAYSQAKIEGENERLETLKQISDLERLGLEILKNSLDSRVEAFAELEAIGGQIISAARKAREAIGRNDDPETNLLEGRKAVANAVELIESEMKRIAGECNSILGDASKSRACLQAKASLVSAKEKLVLQRPGKAVEFVEKARETMDSWRAEREKSLEEKKQLAVLLKELMEKSRQALEKTSVALQTTAGGAATREIPAYPAASAAKKSLEALLPKMSKGLEVLEGGDEAKILSMNSVQLRNWAESGEAQLQQLAGALEQIGELAGKEVSAAEKYNQQFGDSGSSEKLGEAKQKLEQGSYLTAFSIANELNRKLGAGERTQAGGPGTREIVLALSGIAILILLAYVFTKKHEPEGEEVNLPEALEEIKQQEEEGKRKPTVF